jgi:hypothetical protein
MIGMFAHRGDARAFSEDTIAWGTLRYGQKTVLSH